MYFNMLTSRLIYPTSPFLCLSNMDIETQRLKQIAEHPKPERSRDGVKLRLPESKPSVRLSAICHILREWSSVETYPVGI